MENSILYTAILTFILLVIEAGYYIYQTYKRTIQPTIATWFIFSVATFISASSYMVATDKKWLEGVLILSDALFTFLILVSVFFFTRNQMKLNRFQIFYFFSTCGIVILWILTQSAFYANLLVQMLIAVGYIPTIESLLRARQNPESFLAWSLTFAAGGVSLFPAYQAGNKLSILYSIRSMFMVGIVLVLILRLKRRERPL